MTSEHWKLLLEKGIPGLTPGIKEEVGGSAPVTAQVFNLESAHQVRILDLSLAWDSSVLEICAAVDGTSLIWIQPVDEDAEFQSRRDSLQNALPGLFESQQELSSLEEGDSWDDEIDSLGELSVTRRCIKDTGAQNSAVWLGFQADSSVIVFFNPGNPMDHSFSDSEGNSDFDESSYSDELLEDLED